MATRRSRELRHENLRVRGERNLLQVRREVERAVLAEMGEGGEARLARGERMRIRREKLAAHRAQFNAERQRIRKAGGVGVGRVSRDPDLSRGTIGERCDRADEAHDMNGRPLNMSVPRSDWGMVMSALSHMQCHETNEDLKLRTIEALWKKKGGSVGTAPTV